jgi:hypothetical protein
VVAKITLEFDSVVELSTWMHMSVTTQLAEEMRLMNQDINLVIEQLRGVARSDADLKSSLETFIAGQGAIVQKAVQDALAKGVDAEQLSSLRQLGEQLSANNVAMAADILAATPAEPAPESVSTPEPVSTPAPGPVEPTPVVPPTDTSGGI